MNWVSGAGGRSGEERVSKKPVVMVSGSVYVASARCAVRESAFVTVMRCVLAAWGLLCWAPPVLGRTSFIERDSIVFPDHTDTEFSATDKLRECLQDGDNKIEVDGECRKLLTTRDVCPEGKWLVLDLRSASLPKPVIRGVCAPRRCPSGLNYWLPTRTCVGIKDSVLVCPRGNTVDTDFFGDGYCKCNTTSFHIPNRDGACYRAFSRGPCSQDKVWVLVSNSVECRTDHCTNTRTQFPNKVIVPWPDGKCYAEQERGPCPQGKLVQVNSTGHPECLEGLATLSLANLPCSVTDHNGQCTHAVSTPPPQFYNQVALQIRNKRTKK